MINRFIKKHYAFLYYKHYVLKKGIKPLAMFIPVCFPIYVYILCLFAIVFIINKYYHFYNENLFLIISLTQAKIFFGILLAAIFLYVETIIKKVDYRNYQFEYKKDNIFYTVYEITPFVLLFVLVLCTRQF